MLCLISKKFFLIKKKNNNNNVCNENITRERIYERIFKINKRYRMNLLYVYIIRHYQQIHQDFHESRKRLI